MRTSSRAALLMGAATLMIAGCGSGGAGGPVAASEEPTGATEQQDREETSAAATTTPPSSSASTAVTPGTSASEATGTQLPEASTEIGSAPAGLAPPESDVGENSDYGYTVTEYVNFVAQNADRTWTTWFQENGYREPFVQLQFIGPDDPPFQSDCADVDGTGTLVVGSDYPNAFYCPADEMTLDGREYQDEGALIIPILTVQKIWTGDVLGHPSKVAGDFGAAVVVAHEFGHHVQNEWAKQYNALQRQSGQPTIPSPNSKWGELIADCFAGVWANSVYYQGMLEPGDIDEGVAAMEAVGDRGVSRMPHGTPAERRQAVLDGYSSGDPTLCASRYWRTDPAFRVTVD